jgi:hypothetical protein
MLFKDYGKRVDQEYFKVDIKYTYILTPPPIHYIHYTSNEALLVLRTCADNFQGHMTESQSG